MKVLGLESSCDETGIALFDTDSGQMWQRLYSQIEKHREYGGVVPELASRDHVVKAAPLIREILDEFGSVEEIDAIAYTRGPGLMGALMVGASLARGLAWSWMTSNASTASSTLDTNGGSTWRSSSRSRRSKP